MVLDTTPGMVVVFGSGETSPSGRKALDYVFRTLPQSPKVALLETPAGFELNSSRVIGRVGEFLEHRLQNYNPQVRIVPARKRHSSFSPDDPQVVAPLWDADMIFMGPGSPTYAVRQLQGSLAWDILLARHRLGAAIVLASAAAIAVSAYALPVYEIYKVGEDLHWKPGLDFFGSFGFPLVFVPHWNNTDGGEELDTSRCFMGKPRFAELATMLPPMLTIIGIDEKTALMMDIRNQTGRVMGLGGVTLIHTGHGHLPEELAGDLAGTGLDDIAASRSSHVHRYPNGAVFPLSDCCPLAPAVSGAGLPDAIWEQAIEVQRQRGQEEETIIPLEVLELVEKRQLARMAKAWKEADALRSQIIALGWQVLDTPEGPRLEPISSVS